MALTNEDKRWIEELFARCATKEDLVRVETDLVKRIDSVVDLLNSRYERLDDRIGGVEGNIVKQLNTVHSSMDRLVNDSVVKQLNRIHISVNSQIGTMRERFAALSDAYKSMNEICESLSGRLHAHTLIAALDKAAPEDRETKISQILELVNTGSEQVSAGFVEVLELVGREEPA